MFTLQEARKTLPFVKKIIADIVESQKAFNRVTQEIQNTSNSEDKRRKIFDKERLKGNLTEYQEELDLVGCHLKIPALGIVGYYSDPGDGLVVELCWKYGDDDIYYWQQIGQDELLPLEKLYQRSDSKNLA